MDTHEPSEYEQTAPTEPVDEWGEPQQSRWPGVIGTISIVLGSLGVLCYGCNSASTLAAPFLPASMQNQAAQGPQQAIQIAQLCLAFLLSVWLLTSGIGLLRRRSWIRTSLLAWAVVKVVLTIIGTVMGVIFAEDITRQINDSMAASAQAQGGSTPPFTFQASWIIIFVVIMFFWSLIWPTVVAVWMLRANVVEEVQSWGRLDEPV